MSDCEATREQLLDSVKGRLIGPRQARIDEHLERCAECSRIFERERALERALALLPTHTLPESLRARLTAQATAKAIPAKKAKPRLATVFAIAVPLLAAALFALFVGRSYYAPNPALINEAVNDHLRVVYAEHPIEIESGGIHQVKPWFTGRLDFAPPVSFSGDEEFPMVGGAVGLFVDRKAATFIFKHRLHTITLFVFRNEGLPFPAHTDTQVASLPASRITSRGFNLLLWREGDLGYALVSDVNATALARLATKIATH